MTAELRTEFLGEISADLEEPLVLGATPRGVRQIFGIKGGTFEGPRIKGEILCSGADWFLLRPDGVGELDVRATMRTDDGELVYTYYRGILRASPEVWARIARGEAIDSSEVYFRTTPTFETASEKYAWLNRIIAVGVGRMRPNWVGYTVYAVL